LDYILTRSIPDRSRVVTDKIITDIVFNIQKVEEIFEKSELMIDPVNGGNRRDDPQIGNESLIRVNKIRKEYLLVG